MALYQSQLDALAHVRSNAVANKQAARDAATRIMHEAGLTMQQYERVLAAIWKDAPIDVSFHPDRPISPGETVVTGLLATGEYKIQYLADGGFSDFRSAFSR